MRFELSFRRLCSLAMLAICVPAVAFAAAQSSRLSPTNIFAPDSTPAKSVFRISSFVLEICVAIFVVVFALLAYAVVKFRQHKGDEATEPAQVYGSNQMEVAWTILPVLIVVVLFLSTAQVIHRVQDAPPPASAVNVTVVGHQYWWEYRYPQYNIVVANELHVPVSNRENPTPTYLSLLSADVDHSFWVPRLAGKTDLIPNHPNTMWIDPYETGEFLGQCAQFCGAQHAKMLLRVYVQTRADFDAWAEHQQEPAAADPAAAPGAALFVAKACFGCHTVRGKIAVGTTGPDLTHLMSRDTIASGILPNTAENLRAWIHNPDAFKAGSKMPAIPMTDDELNQITTFMLSLR